MRYRLLVALCSAVLLPVLAAWFAPSKVSAGEKQKPYALIFGTVFGPDGRSVYGVKVKIRRADQKKAHWELYSDHAGEFAQRIPVGKADYIVWADTKDYKLPSGKHLKPGTEVTVHIEKDERADLGLHLIW